MSINMACESGNVPIVDIRLDDIKDSLASDIHEGLGAENGKPKSLPTLLLYNTKGLRLFEDITYVDEYYLTNAEIEALSTHAKEIVKQIPDNAQLLELGSGFVPSHRTATSVPSPAVEGRSP